MKQQNSEVDFKEWVCEKVLDGNKMKDCVLATTVTKFRIHFS